VHALAAVIALLALLVFSSSAMASEPPTIEGESVSGVSEHDATLEAQIETGGLYTGYQFEIDTNSSYDFTRFACPFSFPGSAQCMAIVDGEPLPAGLVEPNPRYIPAGSGEQSVSLDLASIGATLQPGTTYHYRVTVSNGAHGAQGPDQTFTTPSTGATGTAPSIDSESVSHVTSTDATLETEINLHEAGAGAYYQFQLVNDPSEYASEILCPVKLPPATDGCDGTQSASALPIGFLPGNTAQPGVDLSAILDLASAGVTLKPGTTYHYRVLVARRVPTEDTIQWEAPTVYGADHTFTTPTPPAIEGESLSHLTSTDATLEAQINTQGLETRYNFYLQEAPLCFKAIPPCERPQHEPLSLPSGELLGSFVGQRVSVDLNSVGVSLSPGEHYEYWVTATSAAGTTTGSAQEFAAPEDRALQPLNTTTSSPSGGNQSGTSSTPAGSGGSPAPGVAPLGSQIVCLCNCAQGCHGKKVSPKHLTRTQKLANALKACKRKPKSERAACRKQAHQKYASVAEKSKKG
jgi:hypothetical protein